MNIKRFVYSAILCLCSVITQRSRAQSYNITDLGALLGTNSYAYGINNQGQVVGYWTETNGARAFLYSAGTVTDLGSLGGTNQYALSINSSGQIVGFASVTNGVRAFLYKNGALTNLGAMGGLNSYAYGINDSGQIVGFIDTTNGARAYFYENGNSTNLGTLGGADSYAYGVNNSNLVVGSSMTASTATHAFLWQNGGLTNLNALISTNAGWVLNDARGINNAGKIVGWGVTNNQEQAFLFNGGQVTKIGTLPGATNSFAFGINNSNQVVGASTLSNSTSRAFVWANGTLTDLNSLLPAGFNWDIREARGVNDKGQIVGWGVTNGQEHAFILSPNTPPSVTLTNPANNSGFAVSSTILLQATAADTDGAIAKVEFYVGATKIGEATSSPFQCSWNNVSAGNYSLTAKAIDDSGATNVSAVVNVTVAVPPSITSQPQSQSVITSGSATFSVTASGATPLSYQWRFKGANIVGATSTNYTIGNVQTVHAGSYSVVVSNIAGTVTSSSASLTVTVDPRNLGKGDWIYFLSDATNHLGQNVATVTDIPSLMNFERLQGMQFIIVKSGDGGMFWDQFDTNLVVEAHSAGLKIFAYGRVYGTNISAEVSVATNALSMGADGFVIDAEIEYESQNLANNNAAAAQYCSGIRSAYPNAFLAYSPFIYISSHSSFPYVTFGTNCDAVMPQCYWKSFGITPSNMVSALNTEWNNWQNSLTGANTNAIKPIVPVGQGWSPSVTNVTTGAEIADFISRLKTISNPASSGGYKGVSFWRADLHTPDMWDRLAGLSIGNPTGAPLIVTQPQNQTITNGFTASFSVLATGVAPLSYQWRFNGLSISGATQSNYSLTNIQSANVGVYSVIVSNASGVVLSDDALLAIPSYVFWTETFESGLGNWATVSGATPLTNSSVQNHTAGGTNSAKMGSTLNKMYRNTGTEIEGNARATFWIYDSGNSTLRAFGELRPYTGNGYGNGSFQQILAVGCYRVNFGTGTGSLATEAYDSTKYQGRVYAGSNTGWFNLNGTNAPNRSVGWHKFQIEKLSDNTTINFYVDDILGRTMTNATAATWDSVAVGSLASGSSSGDAWFDDVSIEYFGVPLITTQPVSKTAVAGTNVTFTVTATGNVSSYQWRFNGSNISGATTSSLSVSNVQSANAGDYTVVVANGVGATVSIAATLTVVYPPVIISNPTNQMVSVGGAATFRVVASGAGVLTYQWKKNGLPLTNSADVLNATTDQLTLTNVVPNDEGSYSVTVTNNAGSATSATAQLLVNSGVIFSDGFSSLLNYWSVVPGATPLGTASSSGTVSSGQAAYQTNSLNKMYHNLGTEVSGRSRATFWIYNANAVQTRSFGEVRGFAGSGLNSGSLQQILAIGDYTVEFDQNTGNLADESRDSSFFQGRVYSGVNSGWFNLNAPGAPTRTLGWHQFAIEKSADGASAHFFVDGVYARTISGITAATWDVVEIGSAGIGTGLSDVAMFDDVKVESLTNVITSQPASSTNVIGTSVSFTVGATGTGLKYQWRKNGSNISGASLSSYTISNLQASDQAVYSALVTTSTDREYSALAHLTAVSTPTIDFPPIGQMIGAGSNAVFTVEASGGALSYQWQKNGTNVSNGGGITGATTMSLTIAHVSQSDEGSYRVVVSNIAGSEVSALASLTVVNPPSILTQPQSTNVAAGSVVTLSVTASGAVPLNYQWKKNGADIAGATNSSLTLTNLVVNDSGYYTVRIVNWANSLSSSNAVLQVIAPPIICVQSSPTNQTVIAGQNVQFSVGVCTSAIPVLPSVSSGALVLWLKSDVGIITNSSGLVEVWQDQSGHANHGFQSVDSNKPGWVNDAVLFSHKPALRFDGIQDEALGDYLHGTNDLGLTNAYTSFVVYSGVGQSNPAERALVLVGTPLDFDHVRACALFGDQLVFSAWANDYPTGLAATNNTFRICSQRIATNNTAVETFDVDGMTSRYSSNTISGVGDPAAGYYIAGLGYQTRNFKGDIAEVIYYRGELSDTDRQAVEEYLKQKYFAIVPPNTYGYQWRRNGTNLVDGGNIAGTHSNTLSLGNVTLESSGTYSALVTNIGGTATSSSAVLEIVAVPVIISQPGSQTICPGSNAVFTTSISGNQLSYEWKKNGLTLTNGGNISGANTAVLTITNVSQSDSGGFSVRATNVAGSVTSVTAQLVMCDAITVDLDIDSDNNNALRAPDRSAAEETIEDDNAESGKYIIVNNGDLNANGVPNFADGINMFDNVGSNASPSFVPVILQISSYSPSATIKFTYADSDPASVGRTTNGTEYTYSAAPGVLRIWTKDGTKPRNVVDVPVGDFVGSGTAYALASLGFETNVLAVKLYVEGIAPSTNSTRIAVEVAGAAGTINEDAVRVTVDLDSDGDGLLDNQEIALGTNPNKADTDGDGRTDAEEIADGTDPLSDASVLHQRLSFWKFDETVGAATTETANTAEGAVPVSQRQAEFSYALSWDWSSLSLRAGRELDPAELWLYYDLYRTPTRPLLTPHRGTLSFWYQPNWQSGIDLVDPTETQERNSLISLVQKGNAEGEELSLGAYWGIEVKNDGTELSFNTKRGETSATKHKLASAAINWQQQDFETNAWHHIALSYSETNLLLFIDGALASSVNSTELGGWPGTLAFTSPWRLSIGGKLGESLANGSYEWIETYNYAMSTNEILEKYHAIADLDSDGDGLPDLVELKFGLSPNNSDSDGDGLPDGWEFKYWKFPPGTNENSGTIALHPNDNGHPDGDEDADGDGRSNRDEFLFGTNPLLAGDAAFSDTPIFDVVGTTNDRSVLINIDFGAPNKQPFYGPAAAGISDGDQWQTIGLSKWQQPLFDSGGSGSAGILFSKKYDPVKITSEGTCPFDWTSNYWHVISSEIDCVCTKLVCTATIWPQGGSAAQSPPSQTMQYPPIPVYLPTKPISPFNNWTHGYNFNSWRFSFGYPWPWSGGVDLGYYDIPLQGGLEWTRASVYLANTASTGSSTAVSQAVFSPPLQYDCTNVCAHPIEYIDILYYDGPTHQSVRSKYGVQGGALDTYSVLPSIAGSVAVHPMYSDCAYSTWDSRTSWISRIDYGSERQCSYWRTDVNAARTSCAVDYLPGQYYRVYLYASPVFPQQGRPVDADKPEWVVINGTQIITNGVSKFTGGVKVKVPTGGYNFQNFIKELNYTTALIQPVNGRILLQWENKNSALSGLQLVELKPMTVAPEVTNNSSASLGVMLQWQPVPQALVYEVLRKAPGQTNYTLAAHVTSRYYYDTAAVGNPGTYQYSVKALSELYSSPATEISVTVPQSTGNEGNHPPILNYVRPLTQAYERMPFVIGAPKLQQAADASDFEKQPLRFVITEILSGSLALISDEGAEQLTNESLRQQPKILDSTCSLRWTPSDGSTGDVPAFKVRAFDGTSLSFAAATVVINVKPQTMLLWWGNRSWGMSSGGFPSAFPLARYDEDAHGVEVASGGWNNDYTVAATPSVIDPSIIERVSNGEVLPVVDGTLRNIVQLATPGWFTYQGPQLALTADGNVWVWGIGVFGGLGDGFEGFPTDGDPELPPWCTPESPMVRQIDGLSNIVHIAANIRADTSSCLAARSDGTVWAWGRANWGRSKGGWGGVATPGISAYSAEIYSAAQPNPFYCLLDIFEGANKPVQIPGLNNIVQVAQGTLISAALSAEGKVYWWGELNAAGMKTDEFQVATVEGDPFVEIACGLEHVLARTKGGDVYVLGTLSGGNPPAPVFGDPTYQSSVAISPHKVPSLSGIRQIATAGFNCYAVREDGTVFQWGEDFNSIPDSRTFVFTPTPVAGLKNIVSVRTSGGDFGGGAAMALDSAGRVWGWGINEEGVLGRPSQYGSGALHVQTPVLIGSVKDVEVVSCSVGNGFAAAIANDVPQHLMAKSGDQSVTLTWDTFPMSQQYFVKRSTDANGPYLPIATAYGKSGSKQTYLDSTAINGNIYYYKVSVSVSGTERDSDYAVATPQPAPSIPIGLVVTNKSRLLDIAWPVAANVETYELYRSETNSSDGFHLIATIDNQIRNAEFVMVQKDGFLVPGHTYWYKVRAVNQTGASELSAVASGTPTSGGPTPPEPLSVVAGTRSAVLTWPKATGTSGQVYYVIRKARAKCVDGPPIALSGTNSLTYDIVDVVTENEDSTQTYEVKGLRIGQCYAFTVSVIDSTGEGANCTSVVERPGANQAVPITIFDNKGGPGTLYLRWQAEALFFTVSVSKGSSPVDICGAHPAVGTMVFPDDSGIAELWLTGLPAGNDYTVTINPFTDDDRSATGTTFAAAAVSDGSTVPGLNSGEYPLKFPLKAIPANNRIELSWWGNSTDDAKDALARFDRWRFILLRKEVSGSATGAFPCDDFEYAAEGTGVTFSDTSVRNGTNYTYRIVGISPSFEVYQRDLGDETPSNTSDDAVAPRPTFPSDAALGVVVTPLNGAIQITRTNNWTFDANTRVELAFWSGDEEESYQELADLTTTASFLHEGLQNGHKYFYRIAATNTVNGDFLLVETNAIPSVDAPLRPPGGFTATLDAGRLVLNWQLVNGAMAYELKKWNGTAFVAMPSVTKAELVDSLGASSAIYRYKISALAKVHGQTSEVRVQPISWEWPGDSTFAATSFKIERQCPVGAGTWTEVGRTSYLRYVDVRTECTDQTAAYRVTPIDQSGQEGTPVDPAPAQLVADDPSLTVPPVSVNTFVDTSEPQQSLSINLVGFEEAVDASHAVRIETPTNLTLRASVKLDSADEVDPKPSVNLVEFYLDGALLGTASSSPYDLEWKNPAGTVAGKNCKVVIRVIDNFGRTKDSQTYYAKVINRPQLKAFTTSATDIQLPSPGLPLQFARSYDSTDNESGMLGRGWKTPWERAHIIVPDLANNWKASRSGLSSAPFDLQETATHTLDVVLPDSSSEHFFAGPRMALAEPDFDSDPDNWIYYVPIGFVPQRSSHGALREKSDDATVQVDALDVYSGREDIILRRDRAPYVPTAFVYTAEDGTQYEFGNPIVDVPQGRQLSLVSMTDRNGNKVTYNHDNDGVFTGLSHSNGRSLEWRQEASGTTATNFYLYDPLSPAPSAPAIGHPVLKYRKENGLLTEVSHIRTRDGTQYDTTRFEYVAAAAESPINGLLKRIINPVKIVVLENDYFGSLSTDATQFPDYLGFLRAQTNSVGVTTRFVHAEDSGSGELTSAMSESVPGQSDSTASVSITSDSAGRIIGTTNAVGETSTLGYDEKGRLSFAQNAAGDYKGFVYDDKDRPIAAIDELGNQTEVAYGAFNQPIATSDASGNQTEYEYYHYVNNHNAEDDNPEGCLSKMIDPSGVVTKYTYNSRGQVLTETRNAPGISTPLVTTYEYDSGDLKVVKEPLWPGAGSKLYTTEYTYDTNGNRETEKRFREVPDRNESGVVTGAALETVTTTYQYDSYNRLTASTVSVHRGSASDTDLQTTTTHYDDDGRPDLIADAFGRVTTNVYNVSGELIETGYPGGGVTRTVYDGKGRALWKQERCIPQANVTTAPATFTEYDAAGRVIAVKRFGGVQLVKEVASAVATNATIVESSSQYRADTGSSHTYFTVNTNVGVDPESYISITRTVYDNLGRVHFSMDNRGTVTEHFYDALGRATNIAVYTAYTVAPLTGTIAPTGAHTDTRYGYDANGNRIWTEDANGNHTDFEFDLLNRPTITRFPAVGSDSNARPFKVTLYDALGRRSKEVDEAGVITAFGYDLLGRLTAVTNDFKPVYGEEAPIVTTYSYDAFGNQTSQTDAKGQTTYYEYDALGRRTHRILPDGSSADTASNSSLERTAYSRMQIPGSSPAVYTLYKEVKDFRGRVTTFEYDIQDRLIKSQQSATDTFNNAVPIQERTTVDYTYTVSGQRASVVQTEGTERTVRYAYDTLGRLRVKDTPEGTLTYEYDAAGTISKISARYIYANWASSPPYQFESLTTNAVDTTRAEWNYRYDTLGRLQKVNADSTATNAAADVSYMYTDVGNLATTTYRNGLATTYNYNHRNWLRNLETKNGAGTRVAFFDYDSSTWNSQFRLSPTGQRRCVQEAFGLQARTVTYSYDSLSRLTAENIVPESTGPTGLVNYRGNVNTPGYDLVGNRRSRLLTSDNGLSAAGVTEAAHTYDSHDLITGGDYVYDSNGNTTQDPRQAIYHYDCENRLVQRTGGTYTNGNGLPEIDIIYDADGNRVGKSVIVGTQTNTTFYLVEDRNPTGYAQVMEEWACTNAAIPVLTRTYVYGLNLISQKQNGTVTYYGYDGLGSTRYLSDASANTIDSYVYDAFGIQIAGDGSTLNNYRYTGEQWDADLGMYYLRARYYKPEIGRFWTMDSFEGRQQDTLSLHKYLYCGGQPISRIDPTGHEFSLVNLTVATAIRATIASATMGTISGVYTYARTGSMEAAFQSAVMTYSTVYLATVCPIGGLAIGAAGLFSLGVHAWVDGFTSTDAAEMATMVAASLVLHASFSRYGPGFSNLRPEDPVGPPIQTFSPAQVSKITRILNYVVTEDGELVVGRRDNSQVGGGHIDLAGGKNVLAAGTLKVVNGVIRYIDNDSGHYQPSSYTARLSAIRAFKIKGLDADGKYIERSFELPRPINIPWKDALGNAAAATAQSEQESEGER